MKEKQLKNEELDQVNGGMVSMGNKQEAKPEVDNLNPGNNSTNDENPAEDNEAPVVDKYFVVY